MFPISSSVRVSFLLVASGLAPMTARASVAELLRPPSFEFTTTSLSAFGSQYVQEISLDMCGWDDRPVGSTCMAQNPNEPWYSWNRQSAVPCAAPTAPRPATSWFDLSASTPCSYGNMGCRTQQWRWADGRFLSGESYQVLHCPSDPAQMGTGLFTVPLQSTRSSHVYLQVPGFFSHSQPKVVRGQVKALVIAGRPSSLPEVSMSATLALQTMGEDGIWRDLATRVIPAVYPASGLDYSVHEVDALIQPYTPVRVELRANTLPPLRVQDENNVWNNYVLTVDLIEARLLLPECIPNQSNPTQCL